ncbi:poly(U)-specific endoribonuclease homolog [Copidosoma floridanum]|uniref:poly(U)-specific endoribonuclease homolog n=1 Tax=Copidosoma floridanum TaxID=29053 RepID=UPI0006C96C16|nr:poly(U)-specific endoribonuclease homolog [Copidosoma floridanum]
MSFLASKGFFKNNINEYKKCLHSLWFKPSWEIHHNVKGSTGFENIFLNNKNNGPNNWIYAAKMEEQRTLQLQNVKFNVLLETAYGFKVTLVGLDSIIFNGRQIFDKQILVGTSPELEMALYTVCYYVRPNEDCSVSFGHVKFTIKIIVEKYWEKEAIVAVDSSAVDEDLLK